MRRDTMDLRFSVNQRKYHKFLDTKWNEIRVATYNINVKAAAHYIDLAVCPVKLLMNKKFEIEALHLREKLTKTDVEIYLNPNTHIKMFLFESDQEQHVHLTSANFTETVWAEFDLYLRMEDKYLSCKKFFDSMISDELTEQLYVNSK